MTVEIQRFLDDPTMAVEAFGAGDLDTIESIAKRLAESSMSLESVERLESLLKHHLVGLLGGELSGEQARKLCKLMMNVGLMFKYKPYAVKASNPFGYSVFLQRPQEGFSFQNHLEHKTEVFHILETLPGGYVFLCQYEDWKKHYQQESFEAWLAGQSHPFFDTCKFHPQPGDTFVISELGVVHTVVGCLLEEFATASTDMVQRLYDQNDRSAVPMPARGEIQNQLNALSLPTEARTVNLLGESISHAPISDIAQPFGRKRLLTDSFLRASHVWVTPGNATHQTVDDQRVTVIRIFRGDCEVLLRDPQESQTNQSVDAMIGKTGDMLLIPKGIEFQIRNSGQEELAFSEHRIRQDVALSV